MQLSKVTVRSSESIPFGNTIMGRELCVADIQTGETTNLVVATTHLESPCPAPPKWDQMYSKERVAQANESLETLGRYRNAILCGDMNWNDKLDGPFPMPDGWIDAWVQLKPGEDGWTYDTKANGMLSANRKMQGRLDRFMCKLEDFKMDGIEMIGTEAIPGVMYIKEKKARNLIRQIELPVFPSDHFGLILTVTQLENDDSL
jgi:tyrosyl-DNA phosphodiesterase 2